MRLEKIAALNIGKARICFFNEGVEVKYCMTSVDRYGVGEGKTIEGISAGSMLTMHGSIITPDKVVSIGG